MGKPLGRLREQRRQRAWSLADVAFELGRLARLLGESHPGADANAVSRWERGIIVPTKYYIRLLCLVFDAWPDELDLAAGPVLLHDLEQSRRRLAEVERTNADREHDQEMENALLAAPPDERTLRSRAVKTRVAEAIAVTVKPPLAYRARKG